MNKRYMIIILGSYSKIEEDVNNIADSKHGVSYVDGNGIFMGTFYSIYSTNEIYDILAHIPAFLLFDISDPTKNAINLPSKYFKGLYPEYGEIQKELSEYIPKIDEMGNDNNIEEYDNINDILDKLSRNKYNRSCLTEKEIEILEKS